ncbi:MAG: hypothetical protein K2J97_04105 [Muribaculaceae bacterium]|nr:hypothetical protein [Muribaculaceae bacterium]
MGAMCSHSSGWPCDVAEAAAAIGYADRDTDTTDMVFVGLGIALGCIIGALSVRIHGIPMALGTSVGALIAGLSLGWLRARRPSFVTYPRRRCGYSTISASTCLLPL